MIIIISIITINLVILIVSLVTGTRFKDYYSLSRYKSFYVYLLKRQLKFFGASEYYLSESELVQYAYRVAKCYECVKQGKCIECKCDTIGRMNNQFDTCSAEKWGVMFTEEEYQKLKRDGSFDCLNFKVEE